MVDYFVCFFVLPLKLSGSIKTLKSDLFSGLINDQFCSIRCCLFEYFIMFTFSSRMQMTALYDAIQSSSQDKHAD